jgi:5-carboxymethyl-2-hydroxymuconate isomerase
MPHIIIECSQHIAKSLDFKNLAQDINQYLAQALPTQVSHCKSRLLPYADYLVGDKTQTSFLHVTLKILPGRTLDLQKAVGEKLMKILNQYIQDKEIAISIEIIELKAETYFKFTS